MAGFGPPELLLVLVIVVILFGVGRISKIAGEMGSGIRAFKKGLKDDDEEKVEAEKEQQKDISDSKV